MQVEGGFACALDLVKYIRCALLLCPLGLAWCALGLAWCARGVLGVRAVICQQPCFCAAGLFVCAVVLPSLRFVGPQCCEWRLLWQCRSVPQSAPLRSGPPEAAHGEHCGLSVLAAVQSLDWRPSLANGPVPPCSAEHGDYFGIGVSGYPEAHPDVIVEDGEQMKKNYWADIDYLKQKVGGNGCSVCMNGWHCACSMLMRRATQWLCSYSAQPGCHVTKLEHLHRLRYSAMRSRGSCGHQPCGEHSRHNAFPPLPNELWLPQIDAGADFVVTQLFYDVDRYLQFVKDCRSAWGC